MKALRVAHKSTDSFLIANSNPPTLIIEVDSSGADLSRYSCFTNKECETSIDGNKIIIKAKNKLVARRTLYKITAPSKKGNDWYWFSHLWIQPGVKE